MKRIVIMSPLFVLAACAGTGMVANKAQGGTSQTRTVEVSSTSTLSLRTTAILEASRQCHTEGKRAHHRSESNRVQTVQPQSGG
jgi:hypothetical protein